MSLSKSENSTRIVRLRVSNFRALRGHFDLNLDADVVLIHGHNAAGKTSLLAAIEYALTGGVGYLRTLGGPSYVDHLVSAGESHAAIEVSGRGELSNSRRGKLRLGTGEVSGLPKLTEDRASVFSERTLLAQATLSRVLTQNAGVDQASSAPLVDFVQDQLGLADLAAVVRGLECAQDPQSSRNASARWMEAQASHRALHTELSELRVRSREANARLARIVDSFAELVASTGSTARPPSDPRAAVRQARTLLQEWWISLSGDDWLGRFQSPSEARNELESLRGLLVGARTNVNRLVSTEGATLTEGPGGADSGQSVRPLVRRAAREINTVRKQTLHVGPLPQAEAVESLEETYLALIVHIEAIAEQIARSTQLRNRMQAAHSRVAQFEARLESDAHDRGLQTSPSSNGSLVEALTILQSHVHDNVCPACERPFDSYPGASLESRLSERLAPYKTLGRNQRADSAHIAALKASAREAYREAQLAEEQLSSYPSLSALFEDHREAEHSRSRLRELRQEIAGWPLEATWNDDSDRAAMATQARHSSALRGAVLDALKEASLALGVPHPVRASELEVERLIRTLDSHSAALTAADDASQRLRSLTDEATILLAEISEAEEQELQIERGVVKLEKRFEQALKRQQMAHLLSVRVRKGFNEVVTGAIDRELNSTWSDYFRRLVPDEPYAPFFSYGMENSGAISLALETRTRSGVLGSSPGAMLSHGNANAAALSLFLALHTSDPRAMPVLVLDDPIQSMDESHVSNFALLVKELSRTCGRQVFIAVHQRELFDYLSLELTPAAPDQRLIAIEIVSRDGGTSIQEVITEYTPDSVTFQQLTS